RRVASPEAEVGRLLAVPGEGRVERAVRVVPGEREVAAPRPDRDDLFAAKRHVGGAVHAREVGLHPAVAGEARVERAVQVVEGYEEVIVRLSHGDDVAVRLAHDRSRGAGARAEVGSLL